jgi:uncharacterized protein
MEISGFSVNIAFPPQYEDTTRRFPVVYLMGETDIEPLIRQLAPHFDKDCIPFIITGIDGKDWNSSFSPWIAPKIGKNLGPFSGGGPLFLQMLEQSILPAIDREYRTVPTPANRVLAGYSLAGLLTLYTLYNSTCFSHYACMSGSLWFPHWIEYIQSHVPAVPSPNIYLSLGSKEKESRNSVMAAVEDCTQRTIETLAPYMPFFEINEGGHFTNVEVRIVKGLIHILHQP